MQEYGPRPPWASGSPRPPKRRSPTARNQSRRAATSGNSCRKPHSSSGRKRVLPGNAPCLQVWSSGRLTYTHIHIRIAGMPRVFLKPGMPTPPARSTELHCRGATDGGGGRCTAGSSATTVTPTPRMRRRLASIRCGTIHRLMVCIEGMQTACPSQTQRNAHTPNCVGRPRATQPESYCNRPSHCFAAQHRCPP